MRNLKVPVPTLTEQKKFIVKIEALEEKIADAQAVIDGAAIRVARKDGHRIDYVD